MIILTASIKNFGRDKHRNWPPAHQEQYCRVLGDYTVNTGETLILSTGWQPASGCIINTGLCMSIRSICFFRFSSGILQVQHQKLSWLSAATVLPPRSTVTHLIMTVAHVSDEGVTTPLPSYTKSFFSFSVWGLGVGYWLRSQSQTQYRPRDSRCI